MNLDCSKNGSLVSSQTWAESREDWNAADRKLLFYHAAICYCCTASSTRSIEEAYRHEIDLTCWRNEKWKSGFP